MAKRRVHKSNAIRNGQRGTGVEPKPNEGRPVISKLTLMRSGRASIFHTARP